MLESAYITFILLSFLFFATSFFMKKPGNKIVFMFLALILFGVLAISSTNVEVVVCNTTKINSTAAGADTLYLMTNSCDSKVFFYGSNLWVFGGFGLIAAVLLVIRIIEAFKTIGGKGGEGYEMG